MQQPDHYDSTRLHLRSINAVIKAAKAIGAISVTLPDGTVIRLVEAPPKSDTASTPEAA